MEPAFSTLTHVVAAIGDSEPVRAALVTAAWKSIAGSSITSRTEVLGYSAGRLTLAVADATWKRQLQELAPQLLAKLNERLGEGVVTYIDFKAGSRKLRAVTGAEKPVDFELPDSLMVAAENITDPDLRRAFAETAAVYLSSKKANGR